MFSYKIPFYVIFPIIGKKVLIIFLFIKVSAIPPVIFTFYFQYISTFPSVLYY